MKHRNGFGPLHFAARLLLALFLVFATYNPSGRSFYHWASDPDGGPLPLQIGVGLILFAAAAFYVRIGTASFGRFPFFLGLLAIALFGTGLRAVMFGSALGAEIAGYATLVAIAVWLTLGLSWPHVSRRLSGQHQTRKV